MITSFRSSTGSTGQLAGPGQVGVLRFHQKLVFGPDYDVPIGAAIDYAVSRSEVDPERLALYGISFVGYFAPRAAAYDTRIKALMANSPIPDLHAYMVGFVGHEISANPPPLTLALCAIAMSPSLAHHERDPKGDRGD